MLPLSLFHTLRTRRYVRPWALAAPIAVLLICVPLLRPLRSPGRTEMSDDEMARVATIQAQVEHHTLAIEGTDFRATRDQINGVADAGRAFPNHYYSDQAPMLAYVLSGPYWVMHRYGLTFDRFPHAVIFWLTLFGVTIPVALAAGLVYRMGRTFELTRPRRALLAFLVVGGTGLISYATVLNAHAPAAALLLAAVACLVHVVAHQRPARAALWLILGGFCAALAATIDPPGAIFLVLLIPVILAFRWPLARRIAGVGVFCLGAAFPLLVHARLMRPVTGDLLPGIFHPELRNNDSGWARASAGEPSNPPSVTPLARQTLVAAQLAAQTIADFGHNSSAASNLDEDDEPLSLWQRTTRGAERIGATFLGGHGALSHFPVLILGIIGVSLIMHRHWPAATKMLAGVTLGGALTVMVVYALCPSDPRDAMFATRWFVVFTPLTLFWAGAWLRRPHPRGAWVAAGVLMVFSVIASIIGATGPLPRYGFDRYTVAGAWHNLTHRTDGASSSALPTLADRGPLDLVSAE